jgi:serine/threonine protein kinase
MQPYGQPLATGTLLENRYRIITLLGEGGMSRVYLADAIRLGTRVAVKENLQTDPHSRAQFEREAQILARLSHPNLPRVTDHFTDAATGRQYLVMDYIEGEDLEQMIARVGRLPEATALAWVQQILYALEYLHSQTPPVVHRDIKPANIKITPQGKAVLVDFGIAKTHDPARGTLTGARAVTPGYAPPEQYGLRTDQRSDIYALGATLYTMLTGRIPPEAPLRSAGDPLIPPRQLVPALSQHTQDTILRAVELQPTLRWQTAREFRTALTAAPPPPISATIPAQQPNTPTVPAWAWAVGSAGAMLVIGLVFAGIVTWLLQPTPTPAPTAAPPTAAPCQLPSRGALLRRRLRRRARLRLRLPAAQRPSWQARRWCSCQQVTLRWAVTTATMRKAATHSLPRRVLDGQVRSDERAIQKVRGCRQVFASLGKQILHPQFVLWQRVVRQLSRDLRIVERREDVL